MALGVRPLRTAQLVRRLHHVSERNVYRYGAKLTDHEMVDRYEEAGVPSTVILSLTEPAGRNLYRLLGRFAATRMAELPTSDNQIQSWGPLSLLSQLWESGVLEHLSHGPHTMTQLIGGAEGLTFHQVTRRMRRFSDAGLLIASPPVGHRKRYELTEHGRRRVALIAGLGRWRHRYAHTGESTGLTGTEMATLLRSALPLVLLPDFSGMGFRLGVTSPADKYGHRTVEGLQAVVGPDGSITCDPADGTSVDGAAVGTMNTWFGALLDGTRGRMRSVGDLALLDACLVQLHDVLWESMSW